MKNGIMEKNIKDSSVIIIIAFAALIAGTVIGAICLMSVDSSGAEGLHSYLNTFFADSQSGVSHLKIFKSALRDNMIYLIIVFIAGFIRIGVVFIAAAIVRKGFILGFTTAAFIKFYSWKGLLITVSMLPGIILVVPALLLFSTASVNLIRIHGQKTKKIVFFFVCLTIIVISIFCIAALSESYLTTIFIKIISEKIL